MKLCPVVQVVLIVFISLSLSGCWFTKGSEPAKVAPQGVEDAKRVEDPNAPAKVSEGATEVAKAQLPPDPCLVNDKISTEPPFFIAEKGVMVTSFLKPCITRQGERGFDKATPWMAMGFPCTAGGGNISTKGPSYVHPKMVSFILSTDCKMQPTTAMEVTMIGRQFAGLTDKSKLMAFNPFAVQYWEIPGIKDADTGFTIDLRSNAALEGIWGKFRGNEPVRVWLYGRENAWVQGDHIFFVEADIIKTGVRKFKLQIASSKSLSRDEINDVKRRCESLRPRRNCMHVF